MSINLGRKSECAANEATENGGLMVAGKLQGELVVLDCGSSIIAGRYRPAHPDFALESESTGSSHECVANATPTIVCPVVKLSVLVHCEPLPSFRQGCLDHLLFLKEPQYFRRSCAKSCSLRIRPVFSRSARCNTTFLLATMAEANSRWSPRAIVEFRREVEVLERACVGALHTWKTEQDADSSRGSSNEEYLCGNDDHADIDPSTTPRSTSSGWR
jgi:hypothetical protein